MANEFYLFNLKNNLYFSHPKYGKYKFSSLDEAKEMLDNFRNYLVDNSLNHLIENVVIIDNEENILNIFEK